MTVQQPTRSYATYQTRGDFNSACDLAAGFAPFDAAECSTRLHGTRGKADHASFLPARASFKFPQFAQAVLDVFAASYWLLYVALWIVVILGLIPFSLFCLFLIQF